jgi:DNA-binding response OmpR family regulator
VPEKAAAGHWPRGRAGLAWPESVAVRVLVVEDELAMRESVAWGLRAEGYTVDTADNGEDGLWKARELPHDVIILDVMLPKLDGYQVCRQLREEGVWTPILMLTAMDDDLDHAEGLDSGADDYLPKPFSYPVLLAHLRALTRRTMSAARPTILRAGRLTLDPASRTVARDGEVCDLTGREVAVLEHLLRHKGRPVSKAELIDHCWDPAFDGPTSVVEVMMHRLRRKIDQDGGPPTVLTLRGEGYLVPADTAPDDREDVAE